MTANLRAIVEQVRGSADAIAVAAGEIAAGNANLSQRTEEHARLPAARRVLAHA